GSGPPREQKRPACNYEEAALVHGTVCGPPLRDEAGGEAAQKRGEREQGRGGGRGQRSRAGAVARGAAERSGTALHGGAGPLRGSGRELGRRALGAELRAQSRAARAPRVQHDERPTTGNRAGNVRLDDRSCRFDYKRVQMGFQR
ncbi:unnamed protein product, partial [Prorocentrum cordatum]